MANSSDTPQDADWICCRGTYRGRPCNKHLAKKIGRGLYETKKKGHHGVIQAGYLICTCCGTKQWIPPQDSSQRASVVPEKSPSKGRSQEATDAR